MDKTSLNHTPTLPIADDKYAFGFWVYLMTDLIMFAALFATYAVLQRNTFGGPGGTDIFNLPFVLTETFILLTSSFTCGLATMAVHEQNIKKILSWFTVTFLLGLTFLIMELTEFHRLTLDGNGPSAAHSCLLTSPWSEPTDYTLLLGCSGC